MNTTIFKVAERGEPILAIKAVDVIESEFNTTWLNELTKALQATMDARLGVGIAAPQVYISKRIIIVASRPNIRYPEAPLMDPIVMVNPKILELSAKMILGEEGCLSVPNERGQVARAESIVVKYQTLTGEIKEQRFDGFPARIVQHEVDHLDGVLFVDRLA